MNIYIQITTRCNMRCAHCGFACTNRGRDMSELVFRRALAFALRVRQCITLGGGEPTIHPKFWEWMTYSRKRLRSLYDEMDCPPVGLVTNGSNTEMSLKLAEMAANDKIWAAVSKDSYHDAIDPRVYKAFERPSFNRYDASLWHMPNEAIRAEERRRERDRRDIRTVGVVRASGRAKSWGDPRFGNFCCGLHLDPDGKLWECICRKVLICDFAKTAGRKVDISRVLGEDWWEHSCTKDRWKAKEREAQEAEEAKRKQQEEEQMRNFKLEGELIAAS